MLFSRAVVHSIYMLCYLNKQDAGRVTPARTLAQAVDVPLEHARKILVRLCAAGLVNATGGRSGGYGSAAGMADISVLDVLDAIGPVVDDNDHQPRMCAASPEEPCSAQPGLADLREQVRRFLAARALASVVAAECSKMSRFPWTSGCDACSEPVDETVAVLS